MVRLVRASERWQAPSAACSTGSFATATRSTPIRLQSLPAAEPPGERDRVLTDDELRAVWHACDGVNPVFARVIRVMMLTGQRRGEVQGMRWDELSDDGKTWTIPACTQQEQESPRGAAVPGGAGADRNAVP